ncbi:MAG: DUF998 domain-containing protein [Candidatus Lokiarchaeota archaeon]|nr:DUF998 domain-containing protein [Candidatus Lokiarchaeota archaeon]
MTKYQKIYAICGMLSPIVFNLIWIIGGIIQPGYNHIRDDVSSLMALGAPNKLLFDIMNIINFVLAIIFLIGLILVIKELEGPIVGPVILLFGQILGITVPIFFPLNYGGEPTGFTGMMHLIIVMITGFIALGGMIAMWRGLRKVDEWKGYDVYSLITFILTLIFTMILVVAAGSEIMGLAERFVIIVNGQYIFVLAFKTYHTNG